MNERIKKLRKALDLTQQEFADKIGMKRNTVANYETGRNEPSAAVISLICREFDVNETWLRTGTGEMFQPEPENELEALAGKYHLSKRVCALVERFLDLRPEIQEAFVDYAIQVAAKLADEPAPVDTRPRSEKPVTEWTEADIEAETEEYRRTLLEEKRRAESGSVSSGSNSSGTA